VRKLYNKCTGEEKLRADERGRIGEGAKKTGRRSMVVKEGGEPTPWRKPAPKGESEFTRVGGENGSRTGK